MQAPNPAWLPARPAPLPGEPPDQPTPDREQPRRGRGLAAFRADVRARLLRARAIERVPPERHGFTVDTASWLFLITGLIYRWYFRTQCFGLDTLPQGPVLLVANHGSHALAWDGANIVTACLLDAEPPRLIHGMAEHRLMELPILGRAARRIGAVDGTRPSCIACCAPGRRSWPFRKGSVPCHDRSGSAIGSPPSDTASRMSRSSRARR